MNDIQVIKIGGSLLDEATRRRTALEQIVALWNRGEEVVLVHGGGKHVDAMLSRLGIPRRTHAGLRVTDAPTLDVVVAVLAGVVNKSLVAELSAMGVRAAGISGADDATLVAELHPPIDGVELGNVGRVVRANRSLIRTMLAGGILPVVSSVALGDGGTLLNVNADSAASAIAIALHASSLRFITDVAGVLSSSGEQFAELSTQQVGQLIAGGAITGGMRPKLDAAVSALHGGVTSVTIGEGNAPTILTAPPRETSHEVVSPMPAGGTGSGAKKQSQSQPAAPAEKGAGRHVAA